MKNCEISLTAVMAGLLSTGLTPPCVVVQPRNQGKASFPCSRGF